VVPMRTIPLLLLVLLLSGCVDSLGIGSGCAAEMQGVRLREGQPQEIAPGRNSERWIYSSKRVYYDFGWGSEGEPCEVDGPTRFERRPSRPDLTL